ncbi:unnamed protein product [Lactuca virosa]|uniref:Uncharacterized protein n=1 Tax=Lactuca virosa TaxID=75947 RepID=A0AAU9MSF9_9ASTR|nr:unnamed protein product [Lactuca virosa]
MLIVTRVACSNSQGAICQQTDMVDPLADLVGILRRGNDGFEDYCFEGADEEETFRSPQAPHTPWAPNTSSMPHCSTSRGISGGHSSNVSDFHASSLPLISRDVEKFGDQKLHRTCICLFWENLDHLWAQFSDIPHEALTHMFSRFEAIHKRMRTYLMHSSVSSKVSRDNLPTWNEKMGNPSTQGFVATIMGCITTSPNTY